MMTNVPKMMPNVPITEWEEQRGFALPPRRAETGGESNKKEKDKKEKDDERDSDRPMGQWHQSMWYPCSSPGVFAYSMLCCCCAMGDIGCYTKKTIFCYPIFCLLAPCPCCIGWAREMVAEKYNLPATETEPEDCSWCFVKLVGVRLLCFISVCFFPCIHVTQMRAELAYRRHGHSSLCPCCCFECGDREFDLGSRPSSPDYPKQQTIQRD